MRLTTRKQRALRRILDWYNFGRFNDIKVNEKSQKQLAAVSKGLEMAVKALADYKRISDAYDTTMKNLDRLAGKLEGIDAGKSAQLNGKELDGSMSVLETSRKIADKMLETLNKTSSQIQLALNHIEVTK